MNLHLGYLPGCIGRIAELHGSFYARTVGFGATFEAKVATELSAFCRAQACRHVHLWTFDELHAARRLYEKHGFKLTHTQRGSQWGKEVNEQRFALET